MANNYAFDTHIFSAAAAPSRIERLPTESETVPS
jgi:hypothetical protein